MHSKGRSWSNDWWVSFTSLLTICSLSHPQRHSSCHSLHIETPGIQLFWCKHRQHVRSRTTKTPVNPTAKEICVDKSLRFYLNRTDPQPRNLVLELLKYLPLRCISILSYYDQSFTILKIFSSEMAENFSFDLSLWIIKKNLFFECGSDVNHWS